MRLLLKSLVGNELNLYSMSSSYHITYLVIAEHAILFRKFVAGFVRLSYTCTRSVAQSTSESLTYGVICQHGRVLSSSQIGRN